MLGLMSNSFEPTFNNEEQLTALFTSKVLGRFGTSWLQHCDIALHSALAPFLSIASSSQGRAGVLRDRMVANTAGSNLSLYGIFPVTISLGA
ncbi:hypothetical protein FRC09_003339 [Ceratobasidium sp. 395]|nr:hypothetical protein FRC09_003339 [Ceratobasidium sp. 395]